ncbi:3,4-dihydroxy-2-butanone-4-phosphate synthase [Nocardia miyunensis]|uniref:3,4-dihydroxy-2-butanone-4-phosphate synthase n=1 Tax=Nocardia miyunensis TaxID=282684 RepID=UPI00082D2662|nr:3,4-dihydroxy-2-butanone-4-phosphate synthase [Nocardia miyunensis]
MNDRETFAHNDTGRLDLVRRLHAAGPRALTDLAAGRVVLLADSCTGEGHLVLPAQFATTAALAFLIRHTSGFVEVALGAADRARTIRTMADPHSGPTDFTRPGHVVPVRAHGTGGLADAVVNLMRRAGVHPMGALGTLVSSRDPARMADRGGWREFAAAHGLSVLPLRSTETALRVTGRTGYRYPAS